MCYHSGMGNHVLKRRIEMSKAEKIIMTALFFALYYIDIYLFLT